MEVEKNSQQSFRITFETNLELDLSLTHQRLNKAKQTQANS